MNSPFAGKGQMYDSSSPYFTPLHLLLVKSETLVDIFHAFIMGFHLHTSNVNIKYSVVKSDGNSFCGDVVLDSFDMAYRGKDSILDQQYEICIANILIS